MELEIERCPPGEKVINNSGLILVLTRSTFALQLGRMMLTNAFPFHSGIPQMASGVPGRYVFGTNLHTGSLRALSLKQIR